MEQTSLMDIEHTSPSYHQTQLEKDRRENNLEESTILDEYINHHENAHKRKFMSCYYNREEADRSEDESSEEVSPCHVSTLEKKICGRWIIKNNENPPNDIEQPITEEVCIQEENMKIYNDNKSAETATTTYSPIYQQEEIEKLLKLADEDCDDLYDLDNTAINNTDENEMEDERDQEPCLYPSLRDHETGSDHDMNYEICNQKKAE
eukprot:UN27248